jgi:hypothetical protein
VATISPLLETPAGQSLARTRLGAVVKENEGGRIIGPDLYPRIARAK